MDEYFAAFPITNATMLCVGGITRAEAERCRDDGQNVDGGGYYLFLARQGESRQPIRLLAKFLSSSEAEETARLFAPHASI
jgi:hypothetical protein